MKKPFLYRLSLAAFAIAATSCSSTGPVLNEGMQAGIAADRVDKVKLYIDANGQVVKRSLYVSRAAIPDWVVRFADEKIGAGSNEYYELEWYAGAPQTRVYEVTRTVKGKKVEVSVNENRQFRYLEKEVTAAALPAPVKKAVAAIPNFRATEYEQKTGPAVNYFEVEGMTGGREVIYIFSPNGELLRKELPVKAELQVEAG